jgi:hypothetical protein
MKNDNIPPAAAIEEAIPMFERIFDDGERRSKKSLRKMQKKFLSCSAACRRHLAMK